MKTIGYTALYQLTYLWLETVEEKLENEQVNLTFQQFLLDLNNAIKENHETELEPIQDSIYEYYEIKVENEQDIERVLEKTKNTFKSLHFDEYPAIIAMIKEVLEEVLES